MGMLSQGTCRQDTTCLSLIRFVFIDLLLVLHCRRAGVFGYWVFSCGSFSPAAWRWLTVHTAAHSGELRLSGSFRRPTSAGHHGFAVVVGRCTHWPSLHQRLSAWGQYRLTGPGATHLEKGQWRTSFVGAHTVRDKTREGVHLSQGNGGHVGG